jgi:hypothetical protein
MIFNKLGMLLMYMDLQRCCGIWIRIPRIRVWTGSGFNGVPRIGSRRAKITYSITLLMAEGFSCSLDVLYGGQRISKLQFFI